MRGKRSGARAQTILLHPAFVVLFCVAALTLLGISILFSASAHSGPDPYFFLKRQVMWAGIAVMAGLTVSLVPLERTRALAWVIFAVVLVGLVLVLAVYFGANQRHVKTFWRGFIIPSVLTGLVAGLVILQPDYGMAALCGAVGFAIMFLAGTRLLYLVPSATTVVALFCTALYLSPMRWRRIMAFLDVEGNRLDSSYQLWQAILAFGAGGVRGTGIGNGRQQMAFLPEAHTDFIFAVIGEELGLVFTGGVLVLFMVIFLIGIVHLRRAPNLYQYLLIVGALMLVTFQALINMAVVTGCMPTQGMPLPFISYGGSNLVVTFMIVGLIVNTAFSWSKSPLPGKKRSLREIVA